MKFVFHMMCIPIVRMVCTISGAETGYKKLNKLQVKRQLVLDRSDLWRSDPKSNKLKLVDTAVNSSGGKQCIDRMSLRFRRSCPLTGYPRSLDRSLHLSRFALRSKARHGWLPWVQPRWSVLWPCGARKKKIISRCNRIEWILFMPMFCLSSIGGLKLTWVVVHDNFQFASIDCRIGVVAAMVANSIMDSAPRYERVGFRFESWLASWLDGLFIAQLDRATRFERVGSRFES